MIKRVSKTIIKGKDKILRWKDIFKGEPCFIIGNSPCLNDYKNIECLNSFFTIGINRTFKRIHTSILMWQDIELIYTEKNNLKGVDSVFFSRDISDPQNIAYHFRLIDGGYKLTDNPLHLYGRGSTGPLALQLANVIGCDPIYVIGCDCKYRENKTDFYGFNKFHKPHTLTNCQSGLDWMKSVKTNKNIIFLDQSEEDKSIILKEEIEKILQFKKDKNYFLKKLNGEI